MIFHLGNKPILIKVLEMNLYKKCNDKSLNDGYSFVKL